MVPAIRSAIRIIVLLVFLAVTDATFASSIFDDDTVLAVELRGPLQTLIDEKESREELPFILGADGVEHAVKVRVRGKSRLRVCDFPPLRLNFREDETEGTLFAGQDKLKLVTHCRDKESAQSDVLEEYAAYKIFNLISDVGYKVRMVRITYRDTGERMKEDVFVRTGFLIESASELADRVAGRPVDVTGVTLGSLDPEQAAAVFIFQYLIGNTDWSLVTADADESCCHNIDIFDISARRYLVPYDFDLSGLANTRYAKPDPSVGIRNVKQRRYRGHCIASGAIEKATNVIAGQKKEILKVLHQVPGLSDKNIEAGNEYLEEFFEQAGDADKLVRSFERRCL